MTTAPDQLTFDQILEQTFPKDIQQKRIRKGKSSSFIEISSFPFPHFLFTNLFPIIELISLNDLDQNYYKINLQNSSLGLKVVVSFISLFFLFPSFQGRIY